MSDLKSLYQEVILDHCKNPRNFRELEGAVRQVEGYNPLCGDRVTVFVEVEDEKVKAVTFQGNGCAISTASASLMTEAIQGLCVDDVLDLEGRFNRLLTGQDEPAPADPMLEGELGQLEVLSGVREYPMRVKCATLAWHAMRTALEQGRADGEPAEGSFVSTE